MNLRMLSFLLIALTSLGAPQALATPECRASLPPAFAPAQLGIGVLGADQQGRLSLAVGHYTGALHDVLLRDLIEHQGIKRILWMGELRYEIRDRRLQILEANETSGAYLRLRVGKLALPRGMRVQNNVEFLPQSVRGPGFQGWHFKRSHQRLADELNKLSGDVRHEIGDSLNSLLAVVIPLHMPKYSDADRLRAIEDLQTKYRDNFQLVNWLIGDFIRTRRLEPANVPQLRSLIDELLSAHPSLATLMGFDDMEINREIQAVLQALQSSAEAGALYMFSGLNLAK